MKTTFTTLKDAQAAYEGERDARLAYAAEIKSITAAYESVIRILAREVGAR